MLPSSTPNHSWLRLFMGAVEVLHPLRKAAHARSTSAARAARRRDREVRSCVAISRTAAISAGVVGGLLCGITLGTGRTTVLGLPAGGTLGIWALTPLTG